MKETNCFSDLFLLVAASVGLLAGAAHATPVVFTIDPSRSVIALSGIAGGITPGMVPQGPGSLQTAYTGAINADVTDSTIRFTGASTINAETNGSWAPGLQGASGTAPADYGAQDGSSFISVTGALRNLVMDLTSAALPITNGGFDSGQLIFTIPTNAATEFDYSGFFSGFELLEGDSTNLAASGTSLTTNGAVQTLTLQVDSTFTHESGGVGLTITLTGQIVATNLIVAPQPVISSFAVSNKNLSLSVQNATGQSVLQTSTDLQNWGPATANVISNGNVTVFTVTLGGGNHFFRVKK